MSKKSNDLQKAFVLHARAYHETSVLVDLITQRLGRVCVIAKGVRTPKSSWRGLLQPFVPLFVSWSGRGELPILKIAEACGSMICLKHRFLLDGFYINELLMRILPRFDQHEAIFDLYEETINQLKEGTSEQILLRCFEKHLLRELGYELQLVREAYRERKIMANQQYLFSMEGGFSLITSPILPERKDMVFSGKSLLAITADDYTDVNVLNDAKRLMRLAFAPLLKYKPLRSRELFLRHKKNEGID